jgi:hypothetical protein
VNRRTDTHGQSQPEQSDSRSRDLEVFAGLIGHCDRVMTKLGDFLGFTENGRRTAPNMEALDELVDEMYQWRDLRLRLDEMLAPYREDSRK